MAGTGYTLGDFTADRAEKHVVIHARVGAKGQFTLEDGSPLPLLRAGARVQLRVRAAHLADQEQRSALSALSVRELLPRGQVLLALVDTRSLEDPALADRLKAAGLLDVLLEARDGTRRYRNRRPEGMVFGEERDQGPKAHEGLVEVHLEEPLVMERKGLKTYRLQSCACVVPALKRTSREPGFDISLNHALTRISEQLELHRISHTGNVFTRYLVPESTGQSWRVSRLGSLRDRLQA
jgi:hypothetical protein